MGPYLEERTGDFRHCDTYERRALLARTLASVYAQTTADREVIVVDDGSTDGTAQFLGSQPVSMIAMAHCGNPATTRQLPGLRAPAVS